MEVGQRFEEGDDELRRAPRPRRLSAHQKELRARVPAHSLERREEKRRVGELPSEKCKHRMGTWLANGARRREEWEDYEVMLQTKNIVKKYRSTTLHTIHTHLSADVVGHARELKLFSLVSCST